MKIGFIGVGRMGSAIAGRLKDAGLDLVVYDSAPAMTAPFAAAGIELALAFRGQRVDAAAGAPAAMRFCFPHRLDLAGRLEVANRGQWIEIAVLAREQHVREPLVIAPDAWLGDARRDRLAHAVVIRLDEIHRARAAGAHERRRAQHAEQLCQLRRFELERLTEDFVAAARRANRIGLDLVELHSAHGYLLHQFLSPLANRRDDEYGGSLENRLRFPLQVARAVRAVWPADKPMGARISGTDWVEGGFTLDEAVAYARALKALGELASPEVVCVGSSTVHIARARRTADETGCHERRGATIC